MPCFRVSKVLDLMTKLIDTKASNDLFAHESRRPDGIVNA